MTNVDPNILLAWRGLLSSWVAWLFTFLLVVVVPTLGYRRLRKLLARGDEVLPSRAKLALYTRTVCAQWLLAAAMLLILRSRGLSAADAGQRLGDVPLTFGVTSALVAVLAVVFWIVLRRVRRAKPATLLASAGHLRKLAPNFGLEMTAFVLVCLTAGVCEELLYRGWLLNLLRAATGSTWAAAVASSMLFGAAHAYQGVKGILRTTFIGLQLAALYVLVGSLVPGQLLHAAVDLLVGVAGALSLARLRAAPR
jgi:uncharacterized protein